MIHQIRKFVENIFVVWVGIIFLLILLLSGKAANVIGYHFPVVTPLEITGVKEVINFGLPSSLIEGTSTKLRDCDQRTMRWYIGEGENEGSVTSMFTEKPQSRKKGVMKFSGIIVGLPPEKLDIARSVVGHDCFGGSVRVISSFYEGKKLE